MGGRLLALLREGPRLIVSLPENSLELARAAADGGADALKVHLNVEHEASGTAFGSFTQEREKLDSILALGLPTGIVPGVAGTLPTPGEMEKLAAMGMDFFDLYDHDMAVWMTRIQDMSRTVAVSQRTSLDAIRRLHELGFEMVEAAVIPHEGYGLPLTVADLTAYQAIREATPLPIIVPTQRAIEPEDVPALIAIGVNALMIGAIVTGREAGSLRRATERFAAATGGGLARRLRSG